MLINTVRPAGKDALDLSAGLRGREMAFSGDVIARHGWSTSTMAEDQEQHRRLVAEGERVAEEADGDVDRPCPVFAGEFKLEALARLAQQRAPKALHGGQPGDPEHCPAA